jgi:hypothetical protein
MCAQRIVSQYFVSSSKEERAKEEAKLKNAETERW